MGMYCDQSTVLFGLLGDAPNAGKVRGKRWPSLLPVPASMKGLENSGETGL